MLCRARVLRRRHRRSRDLPLFFLARLICTTATAAMAQLPAPAVELIALHLARSSTGPNLGGLDPRRCVLPLVCRSWRRTLQLTPGLWEEVGGQTEGLQSLGHCVLCACLDALNMPSLHLQVLICTKDLFPAHTSGCPPPAAAASLAARPSAAISCWFAARAGQVERLTIQLKWSPVHCRQGCGTGRWPELAVWRVALCCQATTADFQATPTPPFDLLAALQVECPAECTDRCAGQLLCQPALPAS